MANYQVSQGMTTDSDRIIECRVARNPHLSQTKHDQTHLREAMKPSRRPALNRTGERRDAYHHHLLYTHFSSLFFQAIIVTVNLYHFSR